VEEDGDDIEVTHGPKQQDAASQDVDMADASSDKDWEGVLVDSESDKEGLSMEEG